MHRNSVIGEGYFSTADLHVLHVIRQLLHVGHVLVWSTPTCQGAHCARINRISVPFAAADAQDVVSKNNGVESKKKGLGEVVFRR